ncbi:MAG: helix-turn-helix transcriptional regulator [Gemmatimonadetes bacterium]|nr:helix-turn-helix transcriptional regulator [Gemmatimonadota bacterium]
MASVSVKKLRTRAKLSQEDLANLLGASWASVSRWERSIAKPAPETRARLERLRTLLDRIGNALPVQDLPRFLQTPQPLLRGHRPVDLLQSGYAFEDLLAFVESAKSGDMA